MITKPIINWHNDTRCYKYDMSNQYADANCYREPIIQHLTLMLL